VVLIIGPALVLLINKSHQFEKSCFIIISLSRFATFPKIYFTPHFHSGLALGLACVFLIVQYLKQELSYDRFHKHAENIYRVTWEDENPQTRIPHPMAQALVVDFPEVERAVSITPLWGLGLTRESFSFRNPEKDIQFNESNVMAVDSVLRRIHVSASKRGSKNSFKKS
jgi:putative ABC transport system permease protein